MPLTLAEAERLLATTTHDPHLLLHNLEKSLFAADELSGIVWATSLMRPTGLSDLEPRSVLKKFKDKRFAAKCSREVILRGVELLGMDLPSVIALCIDGMRSPTAPSQLTNP